MNIRNLILIGAAATLLALSSPAVAQTSTGKVTTAAPTYTNNTAQPLSLDTGGSLRITCDATCSGGGGGATDVNITAVGGNAVTTTVPVSGNVGVTGTVTANQGTAGASPWVTDLTTIGGVAVGSTVPGALDITCVSGCVAGSGVSQGTATTAPPTYITGTNNPLSLDLAGNLRVLVGNSSIPVSGSVTVSGTVTANQGGSWTVAATQSGTWNIGTVASITNPVAVTGTFFQATQPVSGTVTANQGGSWTVATTGTTAPGPIGFHLVATASNNSNLISAGAHGVYNVSTSNNSANIAYLKLYNKATAPTCGTDTPIATYIIPGAASGGAGSNITLASGMGVSLGLGICVVTGIADSDNTSVAASAYVVNVTYQ